MAETSRPVRPFVVPASLAELDGPTVSGRIRLPLHLDWSSDREYDLDDPADRARVYEIVVREGTLDDLRTFVDPLCLTDTLQRMFLPTAIAEAWRALLDAERSRLER